MTEEIKIYMRKVGERWRIVLGHGDGREEISDQCFGSREECEEAIKQYVRDRNGQFERSQ